MCKKIGIAALAVVAGLFVLNRTKLGDWARFAFHSVKERVEATVPPEVELQRMRYEMTQLEPEISKNKDQLAKDIVDLKELKHDIVVAEANLQKRYEEIVSAKKAVEGAGDHVAKVSYNNRKLPPAKAKELIVKDYETYKSAKSALEMRKKLADAKETAIEEATKQLANWQASRDELKAQIDQLEAELNTIRIMEAKHDISFDNTRLTRLKDSIKEFKKSNEVRMTRLALEKGEVVTSEAKPEKAEATDRVWNEIGDEKPSKVAAD